MIYCEVDSEEFDEPYLICDKFLRGNVNRGARMRWPQRVNDLEKIKLKIPSSQGKNDPQVYLEQETKMKKVMDCHNNPEIKKVMLSSIESSDYAIV